MTEYLRSVLDKDAYNKFCVDCNKNESTHCSIMFGVFLCQECAQVHMEELGMDQSYVKTVFLDVWDEYQLKVVTHYGNKQFWDFMKQYGLETREIVAKYKSGPAQYYKKRLAALVMDRSFTQLPPAKDVEEMVDRSVEKGKELGKKAEEGLKRLGTALGSKIEESGIKDKFKGWFN